jgi:hypothetical protein
MDTVKLLKELKDPESAEMELRMCEDINKMPSCV